MCQCTTRLFTPHTLNKWIFSTEKSDFVCLKEVNLDAHTIEQHLQPKGALVEPSIPKATNEITSCGSRLDCGGDIEFVNASTTCALTHDQWSYRSAVVTQHLRKEQINEEQGDLFCDRHRERGGGVWRLSSSWNVISFDSTLFRSKRKWKSCDSQPSSDI